MGVVGETERGDDEAGEEGTSAHAEDSEGNKTVFGFCDHDVLLEADGGPSIFSSSGVRVNGVVVDEGALGIMERGGRILNIWSSDWGGP